jgi:Tol biopolymer transport system component
MTLNRRLEAAAILVGLLVMAGGVTAQAPDEEWRTLVTEHFRVTFPSGLELLGRRAADRAEAAYVALSEHFIEPPRGRIDVLVTDHADLSNGFAQVLPSNRITVFARPPLDEPSLPFFDDWLELVITHELAHVVHLDHTANPVGRLARGVFGRADDGWPYFPGTGTPGWVIEGLATWYESRLTGAGRVHGTYHEMVLRTAVLEGRLEGIDQASGFSPLWPGGGRPYAYGSLFFDHLLERHGEERLDAFVEAVAGQWIPYRLDAAGRDAFGVSLSEAWRTWAQELHERYGSYDAELAALGVVTTPERLTTGARWAFHASVSPDGTTLVHAQADGRSDVQLRWRPASGGPSRAIGRTNGLATYSWLPDGRLLVSQLERSGPYRAYADLYVMDLRGASRRLTRGARLEQPSSSADGSWAVAVQNVGGTNGLVRVELHDGALTPLVLPDPDVHWAFPRISPDGRWIAATRWEPDAYHDVVILEAASGREVHRVTHDRAVDLAPAWSPDGRWLVWASDRTGVMNILGAEVDRATGRADVPLLLTNVRTGVTYPSVDPSGTTLYMSGYHVDGWEVERVAFLPQVASAAPPAHERFELRGPLRTRSEAGGEIEDYSVFRTLLPRYWLPRYREPVRSPSLTGPGISVPSRELLGFGLGLETSGFDVVARHGFGAYAHVFTTGPEVEAGIGYSYRGFGNPVLTLTAEQRWGAEGAFLAGAPFPDTLFVLERERRVDVSAGFAVSRWRRDVTLTLGGGLVREDRRLLGSDLEPSTFYVLTRPRSHLADIRAGLAYSTARAHSFQMGGSRGVAASLQTRARRHLGLPASDVDSVGVDRSFEEATGRLRGYVPLWSGGFATHVLALQMSGGAAFGPQAQSGHFRVGGASGSVEDLTGLELFGGSFVFLPVRGYVPGSRAGRWAWAGSAEYRVPLALVNRGLGAWPLHFDRVLGTLFFDAGNAWGPGPRRATLASVGAEVTVQLLGFFRRQLQLRTGLALPLREDGFPGGGGPEVYVRAGLPF